MPCPARGALASSPLSLLRRWRAWQLERAPRQQPQLQQAQARLLATSTAGADSAPSSSSPTPAPAPAATGARVSHSDVVASVAAALERLGVRPGLGCEVCDGLLTVDIALHLATPERRVAVDVTPRPPDMLGGSGGGGGEDDDAAATGRPRSPQTPQRAWALTQVRRQALKAHGWHYVQLPAVEFLGAMGDAEEQDELLRRTVLTAGNEEGGGGHVCTSGCAH